MVGEYHERVNGDETMDPKVLAGGAGAAVGLLLGCVILIPLGEILSRFMISAGSPQDEAPPIGYCVALTAPVLGLVGGILVASKVMSRTKPRRRAAVPPPRRPPGSDDGQQP